MSSRKWTLRNVAGKKKVLCNGVEAQCILYRRFLLHHQIDSFVLSPSCRYGMHGSLFLFRHC